MLRSFLTILCFLPTMLFGKVLITTVAFNQPLFIELQDKCFKAFLEDDYEFIVFSDANTPEMEQRLRETCERLQLQFIPLPSDIHNRPYMYREPWEDKNHPSVRCSNGVQYAYHMFGQNHDDIYMTIDSDLFLVKPLNLHEYIEGYDIASLNAGYTSSSSYVRGQGIVEPRAIVAMWIGIIIMDMPKLPNAETFNVNCGMINGVHVDAGGYTSQYLKNNPDVRWMRFDKMKCQYVHKLNPVDQPGIYEDYLPLVGGNHAMMLMGDYAFLHFHEGTNWALRSNEYYRKKLDPLVSIIDKLVSKVEN